jgi:Flp pilus assembly protein TadG
VHVAKLSTRDDRGAVATVFAVLLSGGVLLGLMALVIDVGQFYVERGELQSGADAAALGVARACATAAPECATRDTVRALAQRYADENASDGVSKVDVVCGRLSPTIVDTCPPDNPNRTACLGARPTTGNYVEVRLVTELPDGRLLLPPSFSQAVLSDFDGVAVGACGRAAWQVRIDVPLLGVAMSRCDFDAADIGDEVTIGDASRCRPADRRGAVLDDASTACEVTLPGDAAIAGHALADLRFPVGGDCKKRLHRGIADRQVVYLPVYDDVSGPAVDPIFGMVGAVGVVVTGYLDRTDSDIPPDAGPPTTDPRCAGPQSRCISMRVVEKIGPFALVGRSTLGLVG